MPSSLQVQMMKDLLLLSVVVKENRDRNSQAWSLHWNFFLDYFIELMGRGHGYVVNLLPLSSGTAVMCSVSPAELVNVLTEFVLLCRL